MLLSREWIRRAAWFAVGTVLVGLAINVVSGIWIDYLKEKSQYHPVQWVESVISFLGSDWARWIGGGFVGFFAGVFLDGYSRRKEAGSPIATVKPMSLAETLESYLGKYEALLLKAESAKGDLQVAELRSECETLSLSAMRYLMADGKPLGVIPQHIFGPLHVRGTFVKPADWSESKHKLWSELNSRALHLRDFLQQLNGTSDTSIAVLRT